MEYTIEEIKGFRAVGLKRTYNCQNGENFAKIPMFWQEVMTNGEFNNVMALMDGDIKGAMGICANFDGMNMDYFIAVASNRDVPTNMEDIFVETQSYITFTCTMDKLQETTKRIYGEWLPNSKYECIMDAPNLEIYPDEKNCKICVPIKK